MKVSRGFTLIELLVVISIVSLLSTVVMSSLNSARTKASFNASTAQSAALDRGIGSQAELWLNFDECSTTGYKDISGNGRNPTITGGGATNSTTVPWKSGCSLALAGGSARNVSIPQPLTSGSPFTIALWYYPTGVSGGCDMLYSGTDNQDLQLFFGGCGTNYLRTSIENAEVQTNFALHSGNINQWHFIVWAYNYQRNRVWVDGQNYLDVAQTTGLTIGDSTVNIGSTLNGASYLIGGIIDEFRVFSTALTASEAQQLYAEALEKHALAANQ